MMGCWSFGIWGSGFSGIGFFGRKESEGTYKRKGVGDGIEEGSE